VLGAFVISVIHLYQSSCNTGTVTTNNVNLDNLSAVTELGSGKDRSPVTPEPRFSVITLCCLVPVPQRSS